MDSCPKCNKVILSDYKFCPRCGHSLYGDIPAQQEEKEGEQISFAYNRTALKFFNLAQNLSSAENIDLLLKKIQQAAIDIIGGERASILLLDETGENLYFKTAKGEELLKKLKIPVGEGIAGWVASHKQPLIVNDPYNDNRFSPETDKATGFRTRSIIAVPMKENSELVGVVEVINKTNGKFTEQDIEILSGFAQLAAVSISDRKLKTDQSSLFSNLLDYLVMGSEALSITEPTKKGHSWEMARLAPILGKKIDLPRERQIIIQRAALLHDIGFLGLENPNLLGIQIDQELDQDSRYRLHPLIGSEMVKGIKITKDLTPFIMYHHKYRNNEGFPENISPDNITYETEIISLLENYFMTKDINNINPQRFSSEVFEAFKELIS